MAAHCLAVSSLPLSGLPPLLCLLLTLLLGLNSWLRAPRCPPLAIVQAAGSWTVPAWGVTAARPGAGSVRTSWLVRVVLAGPAGRRTLLLPRDSLTDAQWRRLQVLLGA